MSAPIIVYGPSSAPAAAPVAVEGGSEMAELAQLQAAEKEESNRQQIMIGIIVAVLGAGAVYLLWGRPKKKEPAAAVQGLHAAPAWGASGPPPSTWGASGPPPLYGGPFGARGGAPPGAWAPPHPPPRYG